MTTYQERKRRMLEIEAKYFTKYIEEITDNLEKIYRADEKEPKKSRYEKYSSIVASHQELEELGILFNIR